MAPLNRIWSTSGVGQYRASERHVGWFDRSYVPNGTRRGIVWCHGSLQNATSVRPEAFAAAGYPVITADLCAAAYSLRNWANDDHIDAIGDAVTYLTGTLGAKTDKVCLYGVSMGAAGALAWARANLSSVAACTVVLPVLDIDDIYQNDKNSLRASIGTAYGVTYPTSLGDLSTHAPVSFGASDLAGLPLKMWASSDDPIASTTASCTSWDGKGATKTVVDLGAVAHDGSSISYADVVAFFDANGGRS